jgi:hypothetical protein
MPFSVFGMIFTICIFMKQIMEKTTTRTAEFWVDEQDIFWVKMLPATNIDEEDMTDNLLVTRNLTGNKPFLKVLDSRAKWKMSPEAEAIYKREDSPERTTARAVITDSMFDRLLQSFFVRLFKPTVPLKFFTDEVEAIKWLLTFKQ